jgi:hypothetical protein
MTIQRTGLATPELEWFKSSYSTGNGGECVEVALAATHIRIRDSKRLDGPILSFGPEAWDALVGLITE